MGTQTQSLPTLEQIVTAITNKVILPEKNLYNWIEYEKDEESTKDCAHYCNAVYNVTIYKNATTLRLSKTGKTVLTDFEDKYTLVYYDVKQSCTINSFIELKETVYL